MTNLAESLGWICFLLACAAASGFLVKGILKLVWDQGAQGNVVDGTDLIFAVGSMCMDLLKAMKSNWQATVCTAAVMLLTSLTPVSFYACLGYSVAAFAVTGLFTPKLKRQLDTMSGETSQQTSRSVDESSDS